MAVGRRFRLGGSFRPLSPRESKFQLNGNGFLLVAGGAISLDGCTKIDQGGAFRADVTASGRTAAIFAWHNDCDYGQYIPTKALPFGRIGRMIDRPKGKADIQGTAPDDDPV
jgi:hypothetical protein